MTDPIDPKTVTRPPERCTECDRVAEHYNTFVLPTNDQRVICWECLQRMEKGFISNRPFYRQARSHTIPR